MQAVSVEALRKHRVDQIEERMRFGLGQNVDDLVFTTQTVETVNPRVFSRNFSLLVKRAKLPAVSFHGLRHTHLTKLLKDGEHIKVVSERAGHANVSITLGVYGHVIPGMQQETARRIDASMRPLLGK